MAAGLEPLMWWDAKHARTEIDEPAPHSLRDFFARLEFGAALLRRTGNGIGCAIRIGAGPPHLAALTAGLSRLQRDQMETKARKGMQRALARSLPITAELVGLLSGIPMLIL